MDRSPDPAVEKGLEDSLLLDGIIGLLAGVAATGPMTATMILWHTQAMFPKITAHTAARS